MNNMSKMYIFLIIFLGAILLLSCKGKEIGTNEVAQQVEPVVISDSDPSLGIKEDDVKTDISIGFLDENNSIRDYDHNEKLIGYWGFDFPETSGANGYYFSSYGYYVFFNFKDMDNINARYSGTLGFWYTEGSDIIISAENIFYWEDDYVELPWGGYTTTKDNTLYFEEKDRVWTKIGSLNDYIEKANDLPSILPMVYSSNLEFTETPTELFKLLDEGQLKTDRIDITKLNIMDLYLHTIQLVFSGGMKSDYVK